MRAGLIYWSSVNDRGRSSPSTQAYACTYVFYPLSSPLPDTQKGSRRHLSTPPNTSYPRADKIRSDWESNPDYKNDTAARVERRGVRIRILCTNRYTIRPVDVEEGRSAGECGAGSRRLCALLRAQEDDTKKPNTIWEGRAIEVLTDRRLMCRI